MFRMTVAQDPKTGADIATLAYDGREFRAVSCNGATMDVARQVMRAGIPDAPYEVRNSKGMVAYRGASLYELGCWTVWENDRGCGFRRYVSPLRYSPRCDAAA